MEVNGKLANEAMDFAVEIVRLSDILSEQKDYNISNQICRSGTSIGANISEANYAASRADFINKLRIALKEANETLYWLELAVRAERINSATYETYSKKCSSIRAMLVKSIKTAEKNS